jgi:predicted small lipoprotein YifL
MSSNDLLILGSRRATLALCASLLAACGQKGALYLPPPPGASAPGAPAAPASADGGPGR